MSQDGTDPTLWAGTETITAGTYLIKALLMRSDFVFNKDDHATLTNIKATTGTFTPSFFAATSKITRGSGSFLTDGFVVNNEFEITNTASNPGPFTIASISADGLEIVVNESVVDETGSGDEVMTADDELETGSGYTQDTKLSGAMTVAEDDDLNTGDADFPPISWTASGGSITSPALLFYDAATSDSTIICCFENDVDVTATDTFNWVASAGTLRAA